MNDSGKTVGAAAPQLARRVGLLSLIVYGVGDMVGSGIYGTIGVAAGRMGNAVWIAFIGSMIAAMLTGLSYASLASRYPHAGGAAYIVHRAYRGAFLAYVVGLAVAASGLTSMATSSNVFATTLATFLDGVPLLSATEPWMALLAFIGAVAFVNFIGIRESILANWVCTAVEVSGLVFVIAVGIRFWGSVDYLATPPSPAGGGAGALDLSLVASGAVLTFFSFVGFEDMLNVAEEVKEPERTMPRGIVIAVAVTAILYLAVAVTAVSVVHYADLADASRGAPLQQITARAAPWLPEWVFAFVTLFAVANTVLINYIMGSRLLYGMAKQRLLPAPLARVHARARTPHLAILTLLVLVVALAAIGNISQLASATSLLLLFVFCLVNAALIVLKLRANEPRSRFEVPIAVPALGVLACGGLVVARIARMINDPTESWVGAAVAAGLIAVIVALYYWLRPSGVPETLPEPD
ncbi:MAG TPA: APC family permease [Gammaproteobacteria bacterium]